MREKCPHSESFCSAFSRIRSEYGVRISPYSVQMRENTDQKNFEYGYCSSSITALFKVINSINLIKQPARICTENIVSTEQRQTK